MINNGVFTNPQVTANRNKKARSKNSEHRNGHEKRSIPLSLSHLKQKSSIVYLNKQRLQANLGRSENIGKSQQLHSNHQSNFESSFSKRRFDGFSGSRRDVSTRRLTPSSGAPLIDSNSDDEVDTRHHSDKTGPLSISLNRRHSTRLIGHQEHERKINRSNSKYARNGQEIRRSRSRSDKHNVFNQNVSTTRLQ